MIWCSLDISEGGCFNEDRSGKMYLLCGVNGLLPYGGDH
jgi:hypothetical protein